MSAEASCARVSRRFVVPDFRVADVLREPPVVRDEDVRVLVLRAPRLPDFTVPAVAREGVCRADVFRAPEVDFEAMPTA